MLTSSLLGAHRSQERNLQHTYAPKFAIFHGKNGKKWALFGEKLCFLASAKQLKTSPPLF